MERWIRVNIYMGGAGILLCGASLIFINKIPLFLLPALFGVGITFKCTRNIYKNEGPPKSRKSYNQSKSRKRKK